MLEAKYIVNMKVRRDLENPIYPDKITLKNEASLACS